MPDSTTPSPTPALPARRRRRGPAATPAASLLLLASVLLAACGGESTYEITEVRRTQPSGPSSAAAEGRWVYDLPAGWKALPARRGTLLVFAVAGRDDASCTFSILGGTGGGLEANVNRWRRQMGLEPVDEEAVKALPRRGPFLGHEAVEVDLEGTFQGMGGGQGLENAGLLGWIVLSGGNAAFLKMTGPRGVVEAEREAFEALGGSLDFTRNAPPSSTEGAELPSGHPPLEPQLPEGHPPMDSTGPMPTRPVPPSSLTWTAPGGWEKQPPRMMREVTYVPEGKKQTQCYVSIARGALADNVNRWRGQLGQKALGADEIAKLERIPMLGGEGVLVQITGSFKGMGATGTGDDAMLGVVFERPDDSVFVKMIGPKDEVLGELENFKAFCRSLSAAE